MDAREIFDRIIELCYEIDNHILTGAVAEVEDFDGEADEMLTELEEVMVIVEELQGGDRFIDSLIKEIKELHEELYDL
jgi:hypothetical protein